MQYTESEALLDSSPKEQLHRIVDKVKHINDQAFRQYLLIEVLVPVKDRIF
jgi:hypothetical protein